MADLKVVYIVGPGRSGSTLFADVLAQSPNVVHIGELLWYWKRRQMTPPSLCGCGLAMGTCPFWASVVERSAFATDIDPGLVDKIFTNLGSSFRWPGLWWQGRSGQMVWPNYGERLAQLYQAIADVSGARVVVDSSKQPGPALVVANLERVDARFIHLTRDPRAVVRSWKSPKVDDVSPADSLEVISPLRATLNWNARAIGAEWLVARRAAPGRYKRIAFESFVDAPQQRYVELMEFIGEPASTSLFVDERTVRLSPSHTIAGNPDRRAGDAREIQLDQAWRTELSGRERMAIAAVSAPMMIKFGYHLASTNIN
jgi:hypothetical protein